MNTADDGASSCRASLFKLLITLLFAQNVASSGKEQQTFFLIKELSSSTCESNKDINDIVYRRGYKYSLTVIVPALKRDIILFHSKTQKNNNKQGSGNRDSLQHHATPQHFFSSVKVS